MITDPQPMPVRLDPPGPYETLTAIGLQRIRIATEESPARLCLTLEDGCSLHIPMLRDVFENLRVALEASPEHPDIPQIW